MPSLVAWLDVSVAEQQRAHELLAMRRSPLTQDDLGIGALRDTVSDTLFPGTSTLHTRARYLLLIPWCFRLAATARDSRARLDEIERGLIGTMQSTGATDGLIGVDAGPLVKNLPSVLYWSSLGRWGIRAESSASIDETLAASAARTTTQDDGERRSVDAWLVPDAPDGFPARVDGGFALTPDEATWLRERLLETCQGTALEHYVRHRDCMASGTPWPTDRCEQMSDEVAEQLDDARRFSTLMHGASLLYNHMLAERLLDQEGETEAEAWREQHAERLDGWLPQWQQLADGWDVHVMLDRLARRSTPATQRAKAFTLEWTRHASRMADTGTWHDAEAQEAVGRRERAVKRRLARLGNPERLRAWSGSSGVGAMRFRWSTVRTLLDDIHAGADA